MLNIKSSYILNIILSHLNIKQKLELIIYNKQLQKRLDVNINDYKNVNKRYKVGGKNGKGREYILETDVLFFEGEYLNGKRNGKGTEYHESGKIKSVVEYINGKKNGKGKEYNKKGKLIYEGIYLNDEKNGKGKEYYNNGKIKFEGEYKNGKKWNGKGYDNKGSLIF